MTLIQKLAMAAVLAAVAALTACGDDGSTSDESPGSSQSPTVSESPPSIQPVRLIPPLEGPGRGPAATERTDFREDPEWELPDPADLPPPPEDSEDEIFFPPEEPQCPDGWEQKVRPSEGFSICYPADWEIAGEGYVSEGAEDRWYSIGLFKFANEARDQQFAHVSVYAIPRYARPMTYTRDCPRPYAIVFVGEDAVICPEFPGSPPERDFTSYHVRRGDTDYFVQVVPYEGGSDEDRGVAIQIAHTFQLLEQPSQ